MRAMRTGVMVAVVIALLGAWTTAVSAEDAADPMAPAYFTFTTGEPVEYAEGEVTPIDGTTTEIRGGSVVGTPVEATDPRASGLLASVHNADAFRSDDSHYTTFTTSVRLVNDDGAWSGTGTSMVAFTSKMALGDDIPRSTELTVLTGEGGYQGLTLIMSASDDGDSEAHWGVIVPTDGMPPVPDLPHLPAE